MTRVSLYTVHPILAAGFQTMFAGDESFAFIGAQSSLELLVQQIQRDAPDLLVIEASPVIGLESLKLLVSAVPAGNVVLWIENLSSEFAMQAIRLGVRGILSKTSTAEAHMECFRTVLDGSLWLEPEVSIRMISSRNVALTKRQRQLMGLIVQGLHNREIGYAMGITEGTVKIYLSRLFSKVGVNDRYELALLALKNLAVDQHSASELMPARDGERAVPYAIPNVLTIRHKRDAKYYV